MSDLLEKSYDYCNGNNREKIDPKKGFECIKQAYDDGDIPAMGEFAMYHILGVGTKKNVKIGTELLKKAIKIYLKSESLQKNKFIQNTFGYMYNNGIIFEQDEEKAIEWYNRSAKQNHSVAQNNVGTYYWNQFKNDKALELYTLSAKQGNAGGQYNIGEMFINSDFEKGIKYFILATEQGYNRVKINYPKVYKIIKLRKKLERYQKKELLYKYIGFDIANNVIDYL